MSLNIVHYSIKTTEQKRRYRFRFMLCFFVSLVILSSILYTYVKVVSDEIVYGDGEILKGWHYASAYNFVNVNKTSELKKINNLNEIDPDYEDLYLRLVKTLPSSEQTRYLHINTYYNQLQVKINGQKVYDSFDITTEFGESMNLAVEIPASEVDTNIDIILRSSLLPKLNVILSNDKHGVSAFSLTTVITVMLSILLCVFSVIFIAKALLTKNKRSKTILSSVGITEVLFFCFILFFELLSFAVVDSLFILRLCYLLCMSGTLFLVYTTLRLGEVYEEKRNSIMLVGVLYTTVFSVSSRSDLFFFMIKNFGWLILGLLLAILISYLKSQPEKSLSWFHTGSFILLTLSVSSFWLFISLGLVHFLAPIFLITLLLYNFSTLLNIRAMRKKQEHFDSSMPKEYTALMDLKAKSLGPVGELLEVFLKDPDNFSHVYNVSQYVYLICYHSGMLPGVCETVAKASLLHDIGKLKVPRRVLKKEEALTSEEYELMKMHALYGYEILSSDKSEFMQLAAIIAKQHHERFDGKGYFGLKGNQIHPYAQITGIADVFDAIISDRDYKKAWSFEEGFDYIVEHGGNYFSQQYVEAFVRAKEEIRCIYEKAKAGEMAREVI